MEPILAAGFLGIESFNPPWDVIFLPLFNALIGLYLLLFNDLALAIIVLTLVILGLTLPGRVGGSRLGGRTCRARQDQCTRKDSEPEAPLHGAPL